MERSTGYRIEELARRFGLEARGGDGVIRGVAPLASAALFVFILNWSDYLIALLLTTRQWVTIPVYMASLSSSMTGQLYGAKAALGLIAAVPPVIMGIAIQRHLVRGLTFGALKQ